jgi:hypothetical protein
MQRPAQPSAMNIIEQETTILVHATPCFGAGLLGDLWLSGRFKHLDMNYSQGFQREDVPDSLQPTPPVLTVGVPIRLATSGAGVRSGSLGFMSPSLAIMASSHRDAPYTVYQYPHLDTLYVRNVVLSES